MRKETRIKVKLGNGTKLNYKLSELSDKELRQLLEAAKDINILFE